MNRNPYAPVEHMKWSGDARAERVAFRWYFPTRALPWASANGQRFHHWVLRVKAGDAPAIGEASHILSQLTPSPLGRPELVLAAPTSRAYVENRDFPLYRVARAYAGDLGQGAVALPIERTASVPSAVVRPEQRDSRLQLQTMKLPDKRPPDVKVVLVIDDITTTHATLGACRTLIRGAYPTAWIMTFAFGKTARKGSTPFPDEPVFESVSQAGEWPF